MRAGGLHGIPMPALGDALHRSQLLYPTAMHANVTIQFQQPSGSFVAAQSTDVDTRAPALEALAEAAAFELEAAVRQLPSLPDSIGVRSPAAPVYIEKFGLFRTIF